MSAIGAPPGAGTIVLRVEPPPAGRSPGDRSRRARSRPGRAAPSSVGAVPRWPRVASEPQRVAVTCAGVAPLCRWSADDRLSRARRLLAEYQARQAWVRRARQVSTGLAALDEALGGGLPLGGVCQVCGVAPGSGALRLALALGLAAGGRGLFVIDPTGEFYPPAAAQAGVALPRLVIVRPAGAAAATWAAEQVLRAGGAAIALLARLEARAARRLQLAAEAGGGVGLWVFDRPGTEETAFVAARLEVRREPGAGLSVRVARGRGRAVDLRVDWDHAAQPVSVSAVSGDRAAGVRRIGAG